METDDCGLLLKQIDSMLGKRANASLKQHGVTLSQVGALRAIYSQPGHRAEFKEIEKALHVSQPTTVGILSRLREKGFVDTFDSVENLNAKVAALTESGISVCESAQEEMLEEEGNLLEGFSQEERETFKSMLRRVVANLDE